MDYVFVDLETTGLTPKNAYIIGIGATKVRNGKTVANFETYVRCPAPIPEEITALTGILEEHLVGAPELKEALQAFFDFGRDCTLVGYHLSFDDAFLTYYAKAAGLEYEGVFCRKIDALPLAEQVLSEKLKKFYMRSVAEYFKIPYCRSDCLTDAIITAKVYEKLEGKA